MKAVTFSSSHFATKTWGKIKEREREREREREKREEKRVIKGDKETVIEREQRQWERQSKRKV